MSKSNIIGDKKKGPQWYDATLADRVKEEPNVPKSVIYFDTYEETKKPFRIISKVIRFDGEKEELNKEYALYDEEYIAAVYAHDNAVFMINSNDIFKLEKKEFVSFGVAEGFRYVDLCSSAGELYGVADYQIRDPYLRHEYKICGPLKPGEEPVVIRNLGKVRPFLLSFKDELYYNADLSKTSARSDNCVVNVKTNERIARLPTLIDICAHQGRIFYTHLNNICEWAPSEKVIAERDEEEGGMEGLYSDGVRLYDATRRTIRDTFANKIIYDRGDTNDCIGSFVVVKE